jgi:hypothetical protein
MGPPIRNAQDPRDGTPSPFSPRSQPQPNAQIYTGRKTDQCGVILFGTKGTDNIVDRREPGSGYSHVTEFIPIGTPNAGTLAKLAALEPSTDTIGDRAPVPLSHTYQP